ncbi:signal recognition particle subunit SRP54 [Paenibacillus sp. SORGH_AS306]|uniref:Signal recognition particle protein n=1 Tax=Paenibacillus kyungheensis TaxID=1452732 RepID=A0AAX3M6P7_9BACL|nr:MULTISPECIES: signal recognition particle protein [Paenibacillus]MDQ1233622.1 signal recognition particle subunit SRP54 [Paenibacillus sp. SORGH_AS_0306]MDR6110664.1 signal recognition particle subunit SRP54 [Paenibacillus sp. SORGH_AS_0338]WCT57547.1 signal recognition particle protein [Paenibacillus kyungheensis]WDF49354.1 signal recognition particle protein [Paenibacillus sp. KACC 21273]
MAFESLTTRLQNVFSKLRGKGKVSEEDVNEAMREVRLALLEADVNFKVVKEFISKVKEKAVGTDVMESFTPGMVIIDIVNKELTELMGGTQSKLAKAAKPPTVIMMVGLQGAGKTTTSGKLAKMLQKQNHRPLLVAGDIYRPAAIKQLQVLGEQINAPVFTMGDQTSPVEIARQALQEAKTNNNDYVIIDTAGRLHIDEELMDELRQIHELTNPDEVLLVVDAMTGQDAVNVAENFNSQLQLTGVVLTKLDGDTRGGAALSVKAVTGCPIKFTTLGEKLDAMEAFHPERMASRILGMGDMLSLIEKAQMNIDEDKAKEMERKMRNAEFTFEDFLEQMDQVKKLGPLDQIMDMIPGMGKMKNQNLQVDDKQVGRIEAIVQSMTVQEKQHPEVINHSRRKRIATGSGTSVAEVNRLIKQFDEMRRMMKQFSDMMDPKGGGKNNKMMKQMQKMGGKGMKFPFR